LQQRVLSTQKAKSIKQNRKTNHGCNKRLVLGNRVETPFLQITQKGKYTAPRLACPKTVVGQDPHDERTQEKTNKVKENIIHLRIYLSGSVFNHVRICSHNNAATFIDWFEAQRVLRKRRARTFVQQTTHTGQ
jgi:hypothetical protein